MEVSCKEMERKINRKLKQTGLVFIYFFFPRNRYFFCYQGNLLLRVKK